MSQRQIALCTLIDDGYAIGLATLLKSLRRNNPGVDLPFFVYHGSALSLVSRQLIEREYSPLIYVPIDISNYAKCLFSKYRSWGTSPAWRYELFRNASFDQLIYLDADMLVVGDISGLLAFEGPLGACALPEGEGMELRHAGGFNAGLMSIGRELCVPRVWEELLRVAESRPWSGNQTVLNIVLKRFWQPLPDMFNQTTCVTTAANLPGARILHYVGWQKPWDKEKPFDPYQLEKAGEAICQRLLDMWNEFAPGPG